MAPAPWAADRPWNDMPGLPPELDIETVAVLRACIGARAALAELKASAELIPNQAMLINTIPLLETRDSSEIEGIVTTADRLFQYAQNEQQADPATKEALRYRTALRVGFESLKDKPLCTSTAVEVCRTLKGAALDIRSTPGTQLINDRSRAVIYTPPEGQQRLRDLLANWERFLHGHGELDPLIRLAIGHYQFEAIHPFTDGNGRTGRILNILFLIETGLLTLPILYLSRHLIRYKAAYYQYLLDVTRDQAWEQWILYILAAVEETAIWTTRKILAIRDLADETAARVRTARPKIYSRELVDILFEQPYCRISNIVDKGIAQRQAASRYLSDLAGLGVLQAVSAGREKLFINSRLLDLLQADNR